MDFAEAGTVALDPGYEDLVAQGIALLPGHAPEWTNHNASDPGITLVELLAYFTDALLYRLGRVGAAEHVEFLRLLRGDAGVDDVAGHGASAVRDAIRATVDDMAQLDCAVTLDDHERLALQALSSHADGAGTQVRCLARTDLTRAALAGAAGRVAADVAADAAHVTVVVLAPAGTSRDVETSLLRTVREALAARRLLTSHVHVVAPVPLYLGVRLATTVGARADREALAAAIADSFDAWTPRAAAGAGAGGAAYTLALTEIADRAAAVDGVDGVDAVQLLQASGRRETVQDAASAVGYQVGRRSTIGRDRLGGPSSPVGGRLVRDADGELAAIALQPWEAPHVVVRPQDIAWSDAR